MIIYQSCKEHPCVDVFEVSGVYVLAEHGELGPLGEGERRALLLVTVAAVEVRCGLWENMLIRFGYILKVYRDATLYSDHRIFGQILDLDCFNKCFSV